MTDDEIVRDLALRSQNPKRATSAAGWGYGIEAPSFPCASIETLQGAEQRFVAKVPPLLKRIWTEAANGGVGPGYGLFGIEDGLEDSLTCLPLPDLHLLWLEGSDWDDQTVPVCEWGCGTFSAVDCSKPGGNMVLIVDGFTMVDQCVTFQRWIEDWIAGVDVGSRNYRGSAPLKV